MNICFTTDKQYEKMTLSCIYDIINTRNPATELHFYILGNHLDSPSLFYNFERLDKVEIHVKSINIDDYFNLTKYTKIRYLTETMYLRCLIPELECTRHCDRILYIDPDIFVFKDLSNLFNTDLHDNLIGAVKDFGILNLWGDTSIPPNEYKHFCSGLMLMDLPKLREFEFTKKCIDKITGNIPDQQIINDVLIDKVEYLSPIYSFSYHKILQGVKEYADINLWNRTYDTNYKSIDELKEQMVIMHCHGYKEAQMKNKTLNEMYTTRFKSVENFLANN